MRKYIANHIFVTIHADAGDHIPAKQCQELRKVLQKSWRKKGWRKVKVECTASSTVTVD